MRFKKIREIDNETRKEIYILMAVSFMIGATYGLLIGFGVIFWIILILISLLLGIEVGKHHE